MTESYDMMVITPHPDDSEFAVAGTVARWTAQGKKVVYVVCTNGDKGTGDRSVKPEELAKIREQEELAAARTVGVSEVVFLGYPDQGLEDCDDFRKNLVRQIRRFKPEVVVTASPYRKYMWHRDHRITGQVALDAVFPYARDHLAYPDLLEEGLEPHKVGEVWLWAEETPNLRLDVTDTFETKLKALGCHKSQVGEIAPEMRRRLLDWAKVNARDEDFELGEAFYRVDYRRY